LTPAAAPESQDRIPEVVQPLDLERAVPRPIRLPADPSTVVLQWDHGQTSSGTPSSTLLIRTDGSVQVESFDVMSRERVTRNAQLNAAQMQELLEFVIREEKFFEFESEEVKRSIQSEYQYDVPSRGSSDTTYTRLFCRTADQSHEVQWEQLGTAEVFFGHLPQVQQLCAVEARLRNLSAILQAGGIERVQEVTALLNPQLRKFYPSQRAMTAAELRFVTPAREGSATQYSFSRGDKYRGPEYFAVTILVNEQGVLSFVSVVPNPSQRPPVCPRWPEPSCLEDGGHDLP
jgi:hypothetical protein